MRKIKDKKEKKVKEYRHKKDCVICISYHRGKMPNVYRKSHKRKSILQYLEDMKTEGGCWRCGGGHGIHRTWCESGQRYFKEINFWKEKLDRKIFKEGKGI